MSSMDLIQINDIEWDSITDGEGMRYTVFVQGCPHHCKGCQNPQTHSFEGGKTVKVDSILYDIWYFKDWIDGITLSGGEPFCQPEQCAEIAVEAHNLGLDVWCYTGYLFEDLCKNERFKKLLDNIDILVDGPYIESEKSLDLYFKGSANQRVINVPESLKNDQIILKEYIDE